MWLTWHSPDWEQVNLLNMTSFSNNAIPNEFFKGNSGLLVLMLQPISEEQRSTLFGGLHKRIKKDRYTHGHKMKKSCASAGSLVSWLNPFPLGMKYIKIKVCVSIMLQINELPLCNLVLFLVLFFYFYWLKDFFLKHFFYLLGDYSSFPDFSAMLSQSWLGLERKESMREWDMIPRCLLL